MSVLLLPGQYQPPGNILVTNTQTGEVIEELDSFICSHHGGIEFIKPGSGKKRGFCFSCFDLTCGREKCKECRPFEAWLEAMEATGHNRKRLWDRMEAGGIKGVY